MQTVLRCAAQFRVLLTLVNPSIYTHTHTHTYILYRKPAYKYIFNVYQDTIYQFYVEQHFIPCHTPQGAKAQSKSIILYTIYIP